MQNSARTLVASIHAENTTMARLEAKKPNAVFVPPPRRAVDTLCDWVADNPSFKQSRAYNRLMDAYYESLQHSCR
jgi:hypothetical protein